MSILPEFTSLDQVLKSLTEAVRWCELKADVERPATSLRSLEFTPPALSRGPWDSIASVIQKRSSTMWVNAIAPADIDQLPPGRLLVFELDECTAEGACAVASQGFFDDYDQPPWDSWITFIDEREAGSSRYLVSWVPRVFESLTEGAFDVSSFDFLSWLDKRNFAFVAMLRERGVIV